MAPKYTSTVLVIALLAAVSVTATESPYGTGYAGPQPAPYQAPYQAPPPHAAEVGYAPPQVQVASEQYAANKEHVAAHQVPRQNSIDLFRSESESDSESDSESESESESSGARPLIDGSMSAFVYTVVGGAIAGLLAYA